MYERFTLRVRKTVVHAEKEARTRHQNAIDPGHILLGLIREGDGVGVWALKALGISLDTVRQEVDELIGQGQLAPQDGSLPFSLTGKKLLELSLREALTLGHNYIGTEHLLLALIRQGDDVASQVLVKLGADHDGVCEQVIRILNGPQDKEPAAASDSDETGPSTALDRFGRDLTKDARNGKLDPVIGRDKEIERVMQVLSRRTAASPVLVGDPGVGKTAVVEGLARQIAGNEAAAAFRNKLIYRMDMAALGSGRQDDVSERLQAILAEVRTRGDVIAFLDGGAAPAADVWTIIGPLLGHGDLQVIGAMTPAEYRALLDAHPPLKRTLVPIQLSEPTVPQTVEILRELRDRYGAHHQVWITDDGLAAAAELASERLPGRRLPGKAVELLDEAASLRRTRSDVRPLLECQMTIARLRVQKESAMQAREYEKAADLREEEKKWVARKSAAERAWHGYVEDVDEELVTETVAIMLGLSVRETTGAQQASLSASAALLGDDREVWGMA